MNALFNPGLPLCFFWGGFCIWEVLLCITILFVAHYVGEEELLRFLNAQLSIASLAIISIITD